MPSWLVSVALARSPDPGTQCRAPEDTRFDAELALAPLLRGPTTAFLPSVEVVVTTPRGDRPGLAVVDLAGGCSRIDPATARAFGLDASGDLELSATVGGLHVVGLPVIVDPSAPGLVLGVLGLGGVAAALSPSEGVVRFAPRAGGPALVGSLGAPESVPGRRGDPLRVPGGIRFGPVVVDGTFELRTDRAASQIAASPKLPPSVERGGAESYDVGVRLGEGWLPDTWIHRAPETADPGAIGALGYDVLYAVDVAVDPTTRTIAFRPVTADRSGDASVAALAAAEARYAAEEAAAAGTPDATLPPSDPRATITFDGPGPARTPLGDAGNPVVRDRNLVLAETRWRAGRLEQALEAYSAAARYAGDHCGAHLDLAQRRLAWAGVDRASNDLFRKLVDDPLNRATTLWSQWQGLDEAVRAEVIAGRAPPGGVQVGQPSSCALVYGLRHRQLALAQDPQLSTFERAHERDPGVGWSRLLGLLDAGQYGPAAAVWSLSEGGVPPLWRTLAALRIAAALGQPTKADALWKHLPGAPSDTPLLDALVAYDAAALTPRPAEWTRKLVRQDPRWVPSQLVHALASGEAPPPLDPAALGRAPGSPQLRCQAAVHQALGGDVAGALRALDADPRPAEPDWWAARAVVAHLRHDAAARDRAVAELRTRFPLLPVDRLGLRDPPVVPPR